MIVVDASTLTDYLAGREPALVAVTEVLGTDTEQPLDAPELVWPETLNALRRMALRGDISDDRATQAALELPEVRRKLGGTAVIAVVPPPSRSGPSGSRSPAAVARLRPAEPQRPQERRVPEQRRAA